MNVLQYLMIVMCLKFSNVSPFGGWGPGEGFGHLGRKPPPDNPNADFGFDYFGINKNRFNYSAVVMSHKEPRSMRDPKFVAVAPNSFPFHEVYVHSGSRKVTRKLRKMKSEIQAKLKNSNRFRKAKKLPSRNVPSVPKRNFVTNSPRTKASKGRVKPPKKFPKTSNRARQGLTANDLWRLNRSSHKFTQTMGRKGRRLGNQIPAPRKDRKKQRKQNKFAKQSTQSNHRGFRKRKGRFNGRG